ncbi:MAG: 50S ribosomal protein L25 [Chloroflexota bacterium]
MDELKLEAKQRGVTGKKSRFLRRQGITPTHLFGHGVESQTLQCSTDQLQEVISRAGMTKLINLTIDGDKTPKSVFIKEIQRGAISRKLLHVDFYQVRKGEKIKMEVPIVLVGEAPALKTKGRMLARGITSLHIECMPEKIPEEIVVDVSGLEEVEQPINVQDLGLDPDIEVFAEPDQLVVKVSEAIVKQVEEEAPEEEVAEAEAAEAEEGEPAAEGEKEEE